MSLGRLLPVEPGLALAGVVQPLWQRAGEAAPRVGDVIRELEVLLQRYARAEESAWDESRSVILGDPHQISMRHRAMTRSADRELLAVVSNTTLTSKSAVAVGAQTGTASEGAGGSHGLRIELLRSLMEHVLGSVRVGEQARIITARPIKMKIVDRREAIVGLDESALRRALCPGASLHRRTMPRL